MATMAMHQDATAGSVSVTSWEPIAVSAPPEMSVCAAKAAASVSVCLMSKDRAVTAAAPTFGTWRAERGAPPATVTPTIPSA